MRGHIIDSDAGRRATFARQMLDAKWHAEIFENANEFAAFKANKGFVFAYDEPRSEETLKILNVLKGERQALPVVFYSMDRQIEQVIRAMLLGVTDYLEWPVAPEKLDALIASIDERTKLRRREEECRFEATQLVSTLSPRERDTLVLLTKGHSNKAIARELNISPRTVEIHRANALKKINAASTADAVRIGIYAGLDLADLHRDLVQLSQNPE